MFGWLALLFGRLFGTMLAMSVWWKAVGLALILFALPAAINHIMYSLINNYIGVFNTVTGGVSAYSPSLVGCAGFLGSNIRLPEAFSIMMSFVTVKVSLKMIPFLKW